MENGTMYSRRTRTRPRMDPRGTPEMSWAISEVSEMNREAAIVQVGQHWSTVSTAAVRWRRGGARWREIQAQTSQRGSSGSEPQTEMVGPAGQRAICLFDLRKPSKKISDGTVGKFSWERIQTVKQSLLLVSLLKDNIGHVLHLGSFNSILVDWDFSKFHERHEASPFHTSFLNEDMKIWECGWRHLTNFWQCWTWSSNSWWENGVCGSILWGFVFIHRKTEENKRPKECLTHSNYTYR